jgi:hypothetical protein
VYLRKRKLKFGSRSFEIEFEMRRENTNMKKLSSLPFGEGRGEAQKKPVNAGLQNIRKKFG